MDATLTQILNDLLLSNAEVERLRKEIADLKEQIASQNGQQAPQAIPLEVVKDDR